jgi:hypothetical protein
MVERERGDDVQVNSNGCCLVECQEVLSQSGSESGPQMEVPFHNDVGRRTKKSQQKIGQ